MLQWLTAYYFGFFQEDSVGLGIAPSAWPVLGKRRVIGVSTSRGSGAGGGTVPGVRPAGGQTTQSDESNRRAKTKVQPFYPDLAKKMNITGTVKIEVTVTPDGMVKEARGGWRTSGSGRFRPGRSQEMAF